MSYAKPKARDTIVRRIGAVQRVLAAAQALLEAPSIEGPEDLTATRVVATPAALSGRGVETVEVAGRPALTSGPCRR